MVDGFIASARDDHEFSLQGSRKRFWIHCPYCSHKNEKCDFGKGDGLTEQGAIEAAYEHVQRRHPLMQVLTIEMIQTPYHSMKLSVAEKRSLR